MDNRDIWGYGAGPLTDPVRGRVCIQHGDTYELSTRTLMDLVWGLLWITGTLIDTLRGRLWIQHGGAYGSYMGACVAPVRCTYGPSTGTLMDSRNA